MRIKAPHYFLHGNLVWGSGPEDVWAAYRLDGESYPGLSTKRKTELKERIESFAYEVETDFQVIRRARAWSLDEYAERARATVDPRRGHLEEFNNLIAEHRERLAGRQVVRPETFLFVRLGAPIRAGAVGARLGEIGRDLQRMFGIGDARGLSESQIAELAQREARTFDRLFDYMPCDRARASEVAYLIRSAYTRGLGEPSMDENWKPQAVWVDADDDAGDDEAEPRFEPYQHDLLRLHNSMVEIHPRSLRIESELGVSHQALLVAGELPEEAVFPGGDVELMYVALEAGFPVDIVYTAEYLPNQQAQKLARKRMVDADQQAKQESFGEHGASPQTTEKTFGARELQMRLGASDRPPMLRSALTVAIGAATEEQLEERIERIQREFGRVHLHRPLGEQHRLFIGTLPVRSFPLSDYKAHWLPESFGALIPTGISHAGSDIGPYIGHSLTGSRTPIQFDAAEASKQNRPPTVLLSGSLGSGKTVAMQSLEYQAFLAGSFICDIDPKGGDDHGFSSLPLVAERTETIELGPEERFRGLLDPLRIGSAENREDLTFDFLFGVLPPPVVPEWQTKLRAATKLIAAKPGGTTGDVVDELRSGDAAAQAAAEALDVHLQSGLAQLAYGRAGTTPPDVGDAQVVSLQIRSLSRMLPQPGTPRSDYQEKERIAEGVLSLVAAYALRLCAEDKRRHAVLALDEAWALLSSRSGVVLLSQMARLGRSQNITPILASQIVSDAEQLEPLVGSYFAFGVETDSEATKALQLLRLDEDDESLRHRLIGFREGRCYFRDFEGRVVPMQIDPGERLLNALNTTPYAREPEATAGEPEAEPDVLAV